MPENKEILLRTYPGDHTTAYLELRDHPHETTYGLVKNSIDLHQLIEDYEGPRLCLEFDAKRRPVGIEIIYAADENAGDQ